MPNIKNLGAWFIQNRMQAAPVALTGLAAAAGIGFMSSKGDPRGLYEGPLEAIGGGSAGGFSGAVLGGLAGFGLMAAGMYSPQMRPHVGRWIGKALSSRPVQSLAQTISHAPVPGQGGQALKAFGHSMKNTNFLTPHGEAASFLIQMLKNKQIQKFSQSNLMGVSAASGALAGGAIGGVGGFFTGAWRGGSQLSGPPNQTY